MVSTVSHSAVHNHDPYLGHIILHGALHAARFDRSEHRDFRDGDGIVSDPSILAKVKVGS